MRRVPSTQTSAVPWDSFQKRKQRQKTPILRYSFTSLVSRLTRPGLHTISLYFSFLTFFSSIRNTEVLVWGFFNGFSF